MEVDIGVFVPAQAYERWTRQKNTAYADLPESEKNSDRCEADRILAITYPLEVQAVLIAAKNWANVEEGKARSFTFAAIDTLLSAVRDLIEMEIMNEG